MTLTPTRFIALIENKVPEKALPQLLQYWQVYPFELKLNRDRITKLGDYRHDQRTNRHYVTVNHTLNPYSFLITLVHEIAHRVVTEKYRRHKPHGTQWKQTFSDMMLPFLKVEIFPEPLLSLTRVHLRNPSASTFTDPVLYKALKEYDQDDNRKLLEDLTDGTVFRINKTLYRKEGKKRTRILCTNLSNGRRYLVSAITEVEEVAG